MWSKELCSTCVECKHIAARILELYFRSDIRSAVR